MTTPKERYEERKADRDKMREEYKSQAETESLMLMDMMDRFVTAVERISDTMEATHQARLAAK